MAGGVFDDLMDDEVDLMDEFDELMGIQNVYQVQWTPACIIPHESGRYVVMLKFKSMSGKSSLKLSTADYISREEGKKGTWSTEGFKAVSVVSWVHGLDEYVPDEDDLS